MLADWKSPVDVSSFQAELMLCFERICEEIGRSAVASRGRCSPIVSISSFFTIQVFADAIMPGGRF
jgi:hypothetical protein